MPTVETPEAISGRATGVLFFAGFGSLWLCTALAAAHRLTPITGAGVAALLVLLAVPALRLVARASRAPRTGVDTEAEQRMKRVFNRVNTVQWIAIVASLVLLNVVRRPVLIVPTIATIVGLHLFPLARLFRYPTHYVTGGLLVLWSAAVVIGVRPGQVPATASLGAGVILLASAAATLVMASRAAGRVLRPGEGAAMGRDRGGAAGS